MGARSRRWRLAPKALQRGSAAVPCCWIHHPRSPGIPARPPAGWLQEASRWLTPRYPVPKPEPRTLNYFSWSGANPLRWSGYGRSAPGMSWISRTHIGPRILSRRFDDPFKFDLMMKDIDIALQIASDHGLKMPLCLANQAL